MLENSILNFAAVFSFLLIAGFARKTFKDWLVPSAFFNLFWGLMLLISLVLAPDFYVWPGGPWLLFSWGLLLHIGSIVGWSMGTSDLQNKTQLGLRRYVFVRGKTLDRKSVV